MINARRDLYALNALRPVDGNTTKAISDGGIEEFFAIGGNQPQAEIACQGKRMFKV